MIKNDERIGNSSVLNDKVFSDEEKLQIKQFKDLEMEFISCLDRLIKQRGSNTRYLSISRTNLEQATMWAIRELTG
jgi:hypothetical protein